MNNNVKQVIVFRHDLLKGNNTIRKGKFAAQCCHASINSFLKLFSIVNYPDDRTKYTLSFTKDSIVDAWLNGIFTKVVVYVDDEKELIDLYNKITTESPDIPCTLVEDVGKTEFHGENTITCLGIGPYWSDEIDKFTKNLPLL